MRGVITSRDVLLQPVTICAAFGAACYLRCLKAVISGRRCTFLEVVTAR
jgi:hypothetical protein